MFHVLHLNAQPLALMKIHHRILVYHRCQIHQDIARDILTSHGPFLTCDIYDTTEDQVVPI